MKNLSRWAKTHPRQARLILVLAHVCIALGALTCGFLTYFADIALPPWLPILLANCFFIAYFFYPKKGATQGWFKYSYVRQKSLDFILSTSYALLITAGLNVWLFLNIDGGNNQAAASPILIAQHLKPTGLDKKTAKKHKITDLKASFQELKTAIKTYKAEQKAAGNSAAGGGKGWLIALTVLGALVLGYVVTALACGVACSGSEGLAWGILALGWGGIIWLSIILIKKIARKHAVAG
ncbi:hypothetical protein [Haliscomenobacter sp.]|uniref:hypothetical protein n=1 Tax=Haliscomenobacter sp. TaxID=2717303 RepID=UPI003592EB7F